MHTKLLFLLTTTLLLAAPVAPAQVVTSNADAGAGSLRAVVAAASPGATITFATGLSGQTIADPVLAPLGNYGGPTLTMPPQFGSPAIDASGAVSASTDQRGLPRLVGAAADIGAVELQAAESFYNPMRNAANSGPYTLRSAIASSPAGTTIAFATNLIGQTITLTTGELLISQSLTIVGPGAASLALSGNNASRVFNVNSGVTLNLAGLTLRNGRAAGGANSGVAGSAGGNGLPGGGIFSAGSFTLTACTITGNGSGNGGGGGFAAFGFGGGGSGSGGGGGGVLNSVATTVACNNTIIALNSAATAPDVSGGFTSAGHNFIGKLDGSTGLGAATDIFGTIAVPANPLLGAIANNGGGTLTLALLPARPALDAGNDALAATLVNDQRGAGFARLRGAHVDIGAYELDLPGFSAPTIVTQTVGSVTINPVTHLGGLTVSATVNPNSFVSTAWLQFGLTPSYGNGSAPVSLGSGAVNSVAPLPLAGLAPGLTWHYRVAAASAVGTNYGPDQSISISVPGDVNGDGLVDQSELNSVYGNYVTNSPWLNLTNVAGLGGTNVTFALSNSVLGNYSVQYSTNLVDWLPLGSATPRYGFTDTNAPALPQRYYRLSYP